MSQFFVLPEPYFNFSRMSILFMTANDAYDANLTGEKLLKVLFNTKDCGKLAVCRKKNPPILKSHILDVIIYNCRIYL